MISRYCAWCKPRRYLGDIDDGLPTRIETDGICPACLAIEIEGLRRMQGSSLREKAEGGPAERDTSVSGLSKGRAGKEAARPAKEDV